MITGFLFWSKLADSRPIDWKKLYVSRFYRLVPLYAFTLLSIVAIVFYQTKFNLVEPATKLAADLTKWSFFGTFGTPAINGFRETYIIIAKVLWSLHYEWLFYLSLPFFALLLRKKKPTIVVLLLTLLVIGVICYKVKPNLIHFYAFGGGIAAVYLVKNKFLQSLAIKNLGSLLFIGAIVVGSFVHRFSIVLYLAFLSFAFVLLTCGTSLFGILKTKASHVLGQMAYSLYLLHGISLYLTFRIFGVPDLDVNKFFIIILILTPLVILFCHFTYVYIEKLFIKLGSKYSKKSGAQSTKPLPLPGFLSART